MGSWTRTKPMGETAYSRHGIDKTNQASECVKIRCMNVRGWDVRKFEDVCKELSGWRFDTVGLTETHLRCVNERR